MKEGEWRGRLKGPREARPSVSGLAHFAHFWSLPFLHELLLSSFDAGRLARVNPVAAHHKAGGRAGARASERGRERGRATERPGDRATERTRAKERAREREGKGWSV
eukprot:5219512-Pleurochrysis_carterae.AAC.1